MMSRGRNDAGMVTTFVVVLTMALLLALGLVVDGGRIVDARMEASDLAGAAARAGAQAVVGVRGNQRHLDPVRATVAARTVIANAGVEGSVAATTDQVTVSVTVVRRMAILSIAGVGPRSVTATRSARAVDG
jgi:hypothetical protein